ncbi:MAG: hypothetical protein CFH19_00288 [Alphaproteobacteria bacterium MarineAlpha5_Bin9]|nr:MAG: hypothetical protein CFH19_00288 [Alphaproteobacteria bacterium MarineAlpha5_Bin9]
MDKIKKKLIKLIDKNSNGILLSHFINCCLFDKDGYYNKKNPIGTKGDFITAPEISQLYGEIIGLYILNTWNNKINSKINYIELGPGKGTLTNDIFRITKKFQDFQNSVDLYFIEINELLRKFQKENINISSNKKNIYFWLDKFNIKNKYPSIIIANEFFDCFSIDQYIKPNKVWLEKRIKYNNIDDKFFLFNSKIKDLEFFEKIKKNFDYDISRNLIIEYSKTREKYFKKLCKHIKKNKGVIIISDYGYKKQPNHSTLLSYQLHNQVNILENPGNQDITSHVDFNSFIKISKSYKLNCIFSTQRDFLINHGINERLKNIKNKNNKIDTNIIENGYHKLVDNDKMGNLFKFLIVSSY